MLDKRIKFDERWDRDDDTTVLWFKAPKELLPREYLEAEYMEISIECPTHNLIAENAIVEFSPVKYDEEEEGYVDYDWNEFDIPFDEIEALIKLAEEGKSMILLLGKNDVVEKYAEETLKIDMGNDIVYYPDVTTHHTEMQKYVDIAREDEPPVITTQSNEMIDVLLSSDLNLEVIRVRECNNKICVAKHTKEEAWDLRQTYEMELR